MTKRIFSKLLGYFWIEFELHMSETVKKCLQSTYFYSDLQPSLVRILIWTSNKKKWSKQILSHQILFRMSYQHCDPPIIITFGYLPPSSLTLFCQLVWSWVSNRKFWCLEIFHLYIYMYSKRIFIVLDFWFSLTYGGNLSLVEGQILVYYKYLWHSNAKGTTLS